MLADHSDIRTSRAHASNTSEGQRTLLQTSALDSASICREMPSIRATFCTQQVGLFLLAARAVHTHDVKQDMFRTIEFRNTPKMHLRLG